MVFDSATLVPESFGSENFDDFILKLSIFRLPPEESFLYYIGMGFIPLEHGLSKTPLFSPMGDFISYVWVFSIILWYILN